MPLGPFGEILGTTGTLEALGSDVHHYKSQVVVPRNPKRVKYDEPDKHKMTPSKFLFEMSLNTEQKLANTHVMKVPRKIELLDMGDTSLQKFSKVNIDEPMFQPFPSEIYFQNFKPFEVYEVPLVLRNNDKVPRLIKVSQENSPYFKIISPNDVGHKVGPGLPTTFRVQFTPDENKDYTHELICITERERFLVPIRAIGARGILDFPDFIHFQSCFVKYANTKTLLVRNIGSKEAKFIFKVKAPFYVSPDIGALVVNESIQVTIEFKPLTAGDHKGTLCLIYDTGEEILIGLYGAAQDANIRLNKNSIRIENTYISMANQCTVVITNHSNIITHFKWTRFATHDEEEQQKLLYQIELDREENNDTDRFLEECVTDPMLRDKLSILSRTFQNRKKAVENDTLLFHDDIVSLEPVEGDVWPNSSLEITVVFKPREAVTYTRTAYCNIAGRESRLPLRIRGDGIGPKVDFSCEHLEMGNIFIGSKHTYEIVIANKGDIDAIYSVVQHNSIFSPCFALNPAEGIVMPGGHQAIEVAFCSPYLGDFEEVFFFQIDGQPQQSAVKFSGHVVGPTFNFDVANLKFGIIPFGFLSSQVCHLVNTSLVPMVFSLRVPGDGTNKSVCCTDDINKSPNKIGPPVASDPKEFEILPSMGVIPAQSEIKVTVNLVPNTIRKYEVALVVDVERVGEDIISLPISAKSAVPEITSSSPILNYGRCFLQHPYKHHISLHNDTELDAKYEIVPQDEFGTDNAPISYKSPVPKGIITPHSTVELPLVIKAKALGEQEILCYVNIFGDPQPIAVNVICVGEGPVVHLSPHSLNWGEIPVLLDSERTLTLCNESFIPAKFKAHILRSNTVFRVSPTEGEIPPEETIVLKVKVKLDDCVRFQDKLIINFLDSQTRQIPLHAVGKGTTIVFDPPLGCVLNLGPNFSNRSVKKTFQLTNMGRRIQQLVWQTDVYNILSKTRRDRSKSVCLNGAKQKVSTTALEAYQTVFQLTPNRMELNPGQSVELTIEGFVNGPQNVSEILSCHAIIGRAGGKIPIISVNVRAEFIEPLLNFSTKCAFFRVDKAPNEDLEVQEKQLVMNNVSRLPLTVGLKLAYPFSIILDGQKVYETMVRLQSGDVYTLHIEFDPMFKDDFYIRTIDEVLHITYQEHPHVLLKSNNNVILKNLGLYCSAREVYFPNLEFEKTSVDFGCILNDTEVTRYINITNISPMEVHYHWSFLVGDVSTFVKKMQTTKQKVQAELEEVNILEDLDVLQEDRLDEVDENLRLDIPVDDSQTEDENRSIEEMEELTEGVAEHPHTAQSDIVRPDEIELDANKDEQDSQILLLNDVDVPEKGQLDQEEKLDFKKSSRRRSSDYSRLSLLADEAESLRHNKILTALLLEDDDDEGSVVGVEEVFDILPLYSCLQPGETEQVTLTFYGHANICGEVCAVCKVEDGPTYQLKLTGEASLVEYTFSSKTIDYGKQMYDQTAISTIKLINSGKVGFEFVAVNMDPSFEKFLPPGHVVMVPHSGYIEPFGEQLIQVKFLPSVPEFFKKTFQIQVAHFKPDTITIFGEGVFPRVSLDLPRLRDSWGLYDGLLGEAKKNLEKMIKEEQEKAFRKQDFSAPQEEGMMPTDAKESNMKTVESTKDRLLQLPEQVMREPTELELQMEVERLAVKHFVSQYLLESDNAFAYTSVNNSGDNLIHAACSYSTGGFSDIVLMGTRAKPVLPDYLLDFGYVVLGAVRTHVVRATNTGWFPVSFKLDRHSLQMSGFYTQLDRVRNLPGAPDNETQDFMISFDPRGANLNLGSVEVVAPINIVRGPTIILRLRAFVTMPDMKISDDVLQFGEVKCGECQIITVQLYNHKMVKCEWDTTPVDERKKMEKHVPMHLRRKMRQIKKQPSIFEVLPPTGTLLPGQRINVQVKFMPTEEKLYENRIQFRIAESSQRVLLLCRGYGLEPRLEFERTLVQFDPILPHSVGDEQIITVRNPCSFPIEFYSLEFDTNYLYEERVLRLMRGYDEYNTLLLPPRQVNDKLPYELIDYYQEQYTKLAEEEKARRDAAAEIEAERKAREELEKQKEEAAKLPTIVVQLQETKPEVEKEKKKKKTENKEKEPALMEIKLDTSMTSQDIDQQDRDSELQRESSAEDLVKSDTDTIAPVISSTTIDSSTTGTQSPSTVNVPVVSADSYLTQIEYLLEEKMKTLLASGPGVGELEITPVSAAIARHLGIDLTSEGKAARNRRGIALVVQGAPLSGKTSTAVALATHYEAALLTIDGIVLEAITNGNTPAGLKARELCSQTAKKNFEEFGEQDGLDGDKKVVDGLSMDAVAAHTQAGMVARKNITVAEQKGKLLAGAKTTVVNSSLEGATTSQVPSSPPLVTGPMARRLSISASIAGENGLMSCVLPEEILVEILSERLQLNDCYHGVVFDGLETLFSQSYFTTASAVLKALNNRRFIYFFTLKQDYSVLKEQEEKAQKLKELEELEREKNELKWLEEMDEEEYDALSDDLKSIVDQKFLVLKKERLKRDQERLIREKLEKEAKEEEERRREEEKSRGKGRKTKVPVTLDPKEKDKKAGKPHGVDLPRKTPGSKTAEVEKGQDRPESLATDKSDIPAEKKKEKGRKDVKQSLDHVHAPETKDPAKEAELIMLQRFQNFESAQKDIQDLLELWDRSTLQTRCPVTPSEKSEEDQREQVSGRKGKGKGEKLEKDKQKDQDRRQDRELDKSRLSQDAVNLEIETEKREEGVPNIIIDCANRKFLKPMHVSKTEIPTATTESQEDGFKFANKNKSANRNSDRSNRNRNISSNVYPVAIRSKLMEKVDNISASSKSSQEDVIKSANKNKSANRNSDRSNRNRNLSSNVNPVATRSKLMEKVGNISKSNLQEEDDGPNPYINMKIAEMILASGKLPSVDIVMDGLGLGLKGPPIPPPVNFSVIPYPVRRRHAPVLETGGQYIFVASSLTDPNIGPELKDIDTDGKEDGKSKDGKIPDKAYGRVSSELKVDNRRSAERKKIPQTSSQGAFSQPGQIVPSLDTESPLGISAETEDKVPAPVLTVFRWVVPGCSEVTLRLRFTSTNLGQFDQTLNFELVGTRRRYQVFCRGVCAFPSINREPRIVFANRKKNRGPNKIVHKKYIMSTEMFEFGPLLVGKSRDRYQEGIYPENMENVTILNNSPMLTEVSFCFLNDSKGETFLLEPQLMILKSGESAKLTIWAYPKGPGHYDDAVVCCMEENPEPILFKLCCDGFRPELELDKKVLQFDRVLLHRKDTQTIFLQNRTQLPVAWKLSGLENLGDEFTVAASSGIVEPLSEYPLHAYFRAMKATPPNKKMIRIEEDLNCSAQTLNPGEGPQCYLEDGGGSREKMISDADNILGVVQTEPIQVIAEAYDVALDMSFPKDLLDKLSSKKNEFSVDDNMSTYFGPSSSKTQIWTETRPSKKGEKTPIKPASPEDKKTTKSRRLSPHKDLPTFALSTMKDSKGTDGGLDFGIIRVNEESRQTCTLKNKGRYEIAFNFILETVHQKKTDLTALFSVLPSAGKLGASDRPTQVQVIFKSSQEVNIKDMPILKCQVIEPSLGEKGEIIASIPVRVSVKAVFSKFSITPSNDINFGSLLVGSKKTRTFTIENKGEFDFKYLISKKLKDSVLTASQRQNKGTKKNKTEEESLARTPSKFKRSDSLRNEVLKDQSKLTLGMFTIFPTFGIILPKGNQTITVDCLGEIPCKDIQDISIFISDQDPNTSKEGVGYQLLAEACIPAINVDDIGSIFEEHRVCKNLSVWQHMNRGQSEVGGVYGEEEKKFVFNNVIVGRPAKARFKISNTNKVPCDVVLILKPSTQKGAQRSFDVFDLDPTRMQIANNSHMYVTVTFTPQSMQSYSVIFEASIEGLAQNQVRGKPLTFEIFGEGNLPRITVAKPAVRNRRGQPLVLFKRILIGRSESLPLELLNEGTLSSKVDIDLVDPDKCFVLRPNQQIRPGTGDSNYDDHENRKGPHTASVVVNPNETALFEVIYRPVASQRSLANLKVTVVDNQYEDCIVQIIGEGFEDDITLDNIGSVFVPADPEVDFNNMTDDDMPVCGTNMQEKIEEPLDETEDVDENEEKGEEEEEVAQEVENIKSVISSNFIAAQVNVMQFGDCYIKEKRMLNLTMTNHSKSDCIRFKWPNHPELKFSPQVGHLHASCTKDVAITFESSSPQTYVKCPISCHVIKITFDKPIDQVCDWDDKLQVVKWVDVWQTIQKDEAAVAPENKNPDNIDNILEILLFGSSSSLTNAGNAHHPTKKKVIEVETEPPFTEVADSARNLQLLISAISDFAEVSCQVTSINFKDTLMFQTRVYSITLENVGHVALDYNWQVITGGHTAAPTVPPSVTDLSKMDRSESRMATADISYLPFLVEPSDGTILAGKTVNCAVKFAPLDANDYEARLICSIPHLKNSNDCPVISLRGRSLVPYCHFELEDSDYVSSARRNPELRGPGGAPPGSALDPSTRVIEFNVCGVGVKSYKEFGIVNPTNKPYWFQWVCEDEGDTKQLYNFRCVNKDGEIRSGRKFKVGFEFMSRGLDIVESFWRFIIPSESISLPFLLVGNTREPDVCLDRSHVNFKSLLIGHEAMETVYLNNNEDTWFSFSFNESTCHSEGYASHLKVEPISGQVSAKSSVPINLYFSPSSEREVNFNLRCMVQRKAEPLTLNVKAEGYSMNSVLIFEDSTGFRIEFSDRVSNQINFGEIEVSEIAIRQLFIVNSGKFNFDYTWEMNETQAGSSAFTIQPQRGNVPHGQTQQFSLIFCPHKRMSVKDCELQLKVNNGQTYQVSVSGLGVTPGLHLSFQTYNFGNCFIHKAGFDLPPKHVVLHMRNKDKKEISVSCQYEPTSHLTYRFAARVMAPNAVVNVPFTFSPRRAMKYQETVTFEINGLTKQKVEFFGTGIEMKIEVVDPKHKCVNLGARVLNDNVRRIIPIINNSPVSVTFSLAFTPSEPTLQNNSVLSICPADQITLAANGGTTKVEVWFRPMARIPQFTEEVLLECAGMSQPLFIIKGSCLGMEISLDSNSISFGTVFQRSSSSRKLVMSNTGDMNTKFRWDIKRFKPDFSIIPVEGYITPGMDVTFQVDFHPQTISADVRYEKLKCYLDGGPHTPITLTLSGSCTGILPVKEVQTFQAIVRQSDTKQIMIPNKSNQLWNLKPIIDGEYWTGPVTFIVEPQQTKAYELTYRPLTMTLETKKHVGSIFFPLPDGSGLLFNLSGTADAPRAVGKIQRDVPCKTSYVELLTVTNWLKKPQRFRVKIEPLKDKLDTGSSVKGGEYIDIPADSKKDYKLSFYAYKEGSSAVKVIFTNELTGEYQFYEVTFRGTRPGTTATIELSTLVRQSFPHVVNIENPLPYQVNFIVNCTVTEVLFPTQFSIPPNSQGQFTFEYQPLKVGVVRGLLELNSPDLGLYFYDLVLTATPGAPEKAVYFRTSLGSSITQVAKFLNFSKQKTDYTCKVENPDFHVEKSVAAAPGSTGGTEVVLDVLFEPSVLGEQRAMLFISSSVGGEYTIPLFGTCDPPKPQGPFTVKAGTNIPLLFRNVFSTTTQFTFQVDNPLFHVTKQNESIRSHKEHRIIVSFDGSDVGSTAAVMGKLVVSCAHTAGGNSNVQWVYYLKGI